MAPDYRMHLAENVLNEQRTVSYKTLSRAMGVHVNQAKRMLYDFYDRENAKKKGSVHAMYLLAGKKKPAGRSLLNGNSQTNGHAAANPSSPVMSSSMPESEEAEVEIQVETITLVREEDLDDVKASYDSISAIHIYSLEPGRIEDLQTLSDIGREIFANTFVKEDPLEHYKKYGIIQNKFVKRRTGVKPPLPPAPAPSEKIGTTKSSSAVPPASKTQPAATSNSGPFAKAAALKRTDSQDSNRSANTATSTTKPSSLKRDASSIFQSFAKAKPKIEKNEDTAMKDAPFGNDDEEGVDEEEDDAMFLDTGKRTTGSKSTNAAKEEREERARKLRKMMEDSDGEEDAIKQEKAEKDDLIDLDKKQGKVTTTTTSKKTNIKAEKEEEDNGNAKNEAVGEKDEAEWPSSPERPNAASRSTKTEASGAPTDDDDDSHRTTSAPSHRRRGRRKVMKKRTMKDEDGYLVTKEEAVWESFSEDDAEEQKKKIIKAAMKPKSLTGAEAGKGAAGGGGKAGKGGAGNIMSFFSKK